MTPPKKKAPPEVGGLPWSSSVVTDSLTSPANWQVVGRPYAMASGKTVHVRVESVKEPGVTDLRTWGAHERVAVKLERADA